MADQKQPDFSRVALRKAQEFRPTAAMELYAFQRAKHGEDATIKEIAGQIGVRAETPTRWKNKPGFDEWLEERVEYYRAPKLALLEQVAIEQIKDYRFWEAMAKKFGYLTPESNAQSQAPMPSNRDELVRLIHEVRELKEAKG